MPTKICIQCNKNLDNNNFNQKQGKCKECEKEYKKKYSIENKKKLQEKSKKYREENIEIIKERKKKYRDENKDTVKILKRASYLRNKTKEDIRKKKWANKKNEPIKFKNEHKKIYINVLKELLLNTNFKSCQTCKATYKLKYYISTAKKKYETVVCENCRIKKRKNCSNNQDKKRHILLRDLKKELRKGECIDCKINDWRILEFDHIKNHVYGDKIKNVTACSSVESMKLEALKCELRCVNCHRAKTLNEKPRKETTKINKSKIFVDNYKLEICTKCAECDKIVTKENVNVFDFDHIDRTTKGHNLSVMVAKNKSEEKILEEIKKCRLICANCHRLHTLKDMYNKDGFYDDPIKEISL